MNIRRLIFVIVILSTVAPSCFAALHIELPLHGFYRVGRYMPVAVWSDPPDAEPQPLTIAADGAAPTMVQIRLTIEPKMVPLLVTSSALAHIRASTPTQHADAVATLHPLDPSERLVGVAGSNESLAAALFRDAKVFPVLLDTNHPLRDGPLPYQTLDAIVIDGPWPGALQLATLPDLLAGGTAIAVHATDRPDAVLPWERVADGWVLRPHLAGPMGCDGDESAYAPAAGWHPDWSPRVRHEVVFAAILFSFCAGACMLLRGWWSIGAVIALSIVSAGAILFWHRSRSSIFEAKGAIVVDAGAWRQKDDWTYVTAAEPATVHVACDGVTWPIFADPAQAVHSQATLHLPEGIWTGELTAGTRLAFVHRTVHPSREGDVLGGDRAETAMSELARNLYAGARQGVSSQAVSTGASEESSIRWPTVYVQPAP